MEMENTLNIVEKNSIQVSTINFHLNSISYFNCYTNRTF